MTINYTDVHDVDNWVRTAYNKGWQADGSWKCSSCGTMIGKNLLNQKPYLLAWQHVKSRCCTKPIEEKNWGVFPLKVEY